MVFSLSVLLKAYSQPHRVSSGGFGVQFVRLLNRTGSPQGALVFSLSVY